MKKRLFQSLLATLLLAGVFGSLRTAQAQCFISIDPNNNAASIQIYSPFANTLNFDPNPAVNPAVFVDQVFSAPLAVPPGQYLGWCIDTTDDISWGPLTYAALLYSTCDPNLNTYLSGDGYTGTVDATQVNWHALNYLLNHKNGADFWTFQYAVWYFVGGPDPAPGSLPGYPTNNAAVTAALIADASLNAAQWQPKCGDVIGVVVLAPGKGTSDTAINQLTIIEVPVPCTPSITVTKEVACLQPGDNCGTFSKLAEGFKGLTDPAFCYQITVSNSGSMTLTNVMVTDILLGDVTTNFFPTNIFPLGTAYLTPGQSLTNVFKMSVTNAGITTNIVTATALSLNADATAGSSVTNSDYAVAIVDTAAVTCQVTLTSSCGDKDNNPYDNNLILPGCGESCTVYFTVVVSNTGVANLTGVTLSSAVLKSLGFTPNLPTPFNLGTNSSLTFTFSATMSCSGPLNLDIEVNGQVQADGIHCGIYDITSTSPVTVGSSCNGYITCAPCCTPPVILGVPPGGYLGCNPSPSVIPGDSFVKSTITASDHSGPLPASSIGVTHPTPDVITGCTNSRTFTIIATGTCASTTNHVTYTWTVDTDKPIVTCPPPFFVSNTVVTCCTYMPSDYCNYNSTACNTLNNCFNKLYPGGWLNCGITTGNGYCAKFNSSYCVQKFAWCNGGGNPGCLKNNYSNPTYCEAGSFAAHVACLQLNVDCGDNKSVSGFSGGCGDLVLNDPTCSLNGKKVRDILTICHKALGGGDVSSYGCTISSLTTLCSNLNQCYQNGNQSAWCCGHIVPPSIVNIPPSISGMATVYDKCSSTPKLTNTDVITCGPCAGSYTIARTWTAVDACGNSNCCTQIITVGNTTGSVCGYVFTDCNGDGRLTAGIDAGTSNVVVTLKNGSGSVLGTATTDANGSYCFFNLNAGNYSVSIVQPTNCVQTGGCHTNHWLDNSGNDCWNENDGYQHWKGNDGVDCWTASDGYQHYKNSYGQDCWKDSRGYTHYQSCTYTSCNIPKNNCETFTLGACETKTCVNFAYQGVSPKATCSVSGPSKGTCGQTLTYTCTVSNSGSTCFTACQVSACGNNYNCPALKPGEHCTFQINYQCKYSDYGTFKCQANASCSYPGSGNPCYSSAICSTQIGH